jgi:LPXTG-motif cell wall-anchored protein
MPNGGARHGRVVAAIVAICAAPLLASTTALAATGDPGSGTDGVGVVCEQESYSWTGSATVTTAGDVVTTGVTIGSQLGTTLVVVGTSADGLDAANQAVALPVSIGGVRVSAGTAVDAGGAIAIHGPDGGSPSGPLTVTGATVVVNRCAEVAVAGPEPVVPTTVVVSDAGALATTTLPAAATGSSSLPSTGTGSAVPAVASAGALLAIGLACSWWSRRRRSLA